MQRCVKWFLLIGVVCCLLGTGIVTAGLMNGGAKNAKSYVRQSYEHAQKLEEHLEDFDYGY